MVRVEGGARVGFMALVLLSLGGLSLGGRLHQKRTAGGLQQ